MTGYAVARAFDRPRKSLTGGGALPAIDVYVIPWPPPEGWGFELLNTPYDRPVAGPFDTLTEAQAAYRRRMIPVNS